MASSLTAKELLKVEEKVANTSGEDDAKRAHRTETVVPLSRLVQKVSQRDGSFLNRITLELLELFAAGKPTPGAGSAAALIASLSGSLTQSVAQHTIKAAKRHDNYLPFREKAEILFEEARTRSHRLREAVDEDSAAFDQYWQHWRLQVQDAYIAGADETKIADLRARTNEALKRATEIPIEIAEHCIALAEIALELYDRGYRSARGETSTAVLTAIASGEAAMHTAHLNLQSAEIAQWVNDGRQQIRKLSKRLRDLRKLIEARIYGEDQI